MSAFPHLPLFTDAFIADTGHLGALETGAYLMLLMVAWRSPGCRLPLDDKKLARWARVDRRTWDRIKPALMEFWTVQDGFLIQSRLQKEYANASHRANAARVNGATGGRPKSLKENDAPNPAGSDQLTHEKASIPIKGSKEEEEPYHTAQPYLGTAPENDATPARAVPRQGREFYDHVENRLRDSVPWSNSPDIGLKDLSPILALLGGGMDLELDVVPAITAAARKDPTPRRTWKYFIGHISEWHVLRTKPPDVVVPFAKPETERERKDRETREFIHETKQAAPCSMSISTSSSH